jgi:hypothetical protein
MSRPDFSELAVQTLIDLTRAAALHGLQDGHIHPRSCGQQR